CQSDRSCLLSARDVGGADQHLDSPVALPASLSSLMAFDPLLAEGARLDLITGDSARNQRITNGVDPTFAQRLIVLSGPTRIGVTVDTHPCGRILLHIGRDVGYMVCFARPYVRLIEIEQEVPERSPV